MGGAGGAYHMPQATQLESVKPGLTRPLAAPEQVVFTMTLDSSLALENPPALALLPWAPLAMGVRGEGTPAQRGCGDADAGLSRRCWRTPRNSCHLRYRGPETPCPARCPAPRMRWPPE